MSLFALLKIHSFPVRLVRSAPSDSFTLPATSLENINQNISSSSTPPPPDVQRSNSFSSPTVDKTEPSGSSAEPQKVDINPECFTTVMVTSASWQQSDLLGEQRDSVDQSDGSSLSLVAHRQRRLDHRRNKSDPVTPAGLDDLPAMNELLLMSASHLPLMSGDAPNESKEKSSAKVISNNSPVSTKGKHITQDKSSPPSPTMTTTTTITTASTGATKKKRAWYNVSIGDCLLSARCSRMRPELGPPCDASMV